jgi:hypothetical protein
MAYSSKPTQDDSFIMQMRDMRTVSKNIADLYIKTAPHIGQAAELSYVGGEEARRVENMARKNAVFYFKSLVLITCNLPQVIDKKIIEKNIDNPMFTDADTLCRLLDTANPAKMTSQTLQRLWLQYSKLLVKADLINAYKMSEQKNIWS